jgi:hypothetical protein
MDNEWGCLESDAMDTDSEIRCCRIVEELGPGSKVRHVGLRYANAWSIETI